jgi:hypothetical protein
MAINVMSYVWEYSRQQGSFLLTLLAIADWCNKDGTHAYPSLPMIAERTRLSVRQVQRIISTLEEAGELRIQRGRGRGIAHVYTIPMSIKQDKLSPLCRESTLDNVTGDTLGTTPDLENRTSESENTTPHVLPTVILNRNTQPSVYIDKLEPENYPEWYGDLRALPGFEKALQECQQWLTGKGISESRADETAAAVRGQWPGAKNQYKDPWAVFRNWCLRAPPLAAPSQRARATRIDRLASTEELKQGWGNNNA